MQEALGYTTRVYILATSHLQYRTQCCIDWNKMWYSWFIVILQLRDTCLRSSIFKSSVVLAWMDATDRLQQTGPKLFLPPHAVDVYYYIAMVAAAIAAAAALLLKLILIALLVIMALRQCLNSSRLDPSECCCCRPFLCYKHSRPGGGSTYNMKYHQLTFKGYRINLEEISDWANIISSIALYFIFLQGKMRVWRN